MAVCQGISVYSVFTIYVCSSICQVVIDKFDKFSKVMSNSQGFYCPDNREKLKVKTSLVVVKRRQFLCLRCSTLTTVRIKRMEIIS
jgi:hypothetical protein